MEWTEEKEKIFHDNIALAYHFANRYRRELTFCPQDVESLCLIGLMHAVEHFDTDREIKFSTFASICIRNQVFMAYRKEKKQFLAEAPFSSMTNLDKITREELALEEYNLLLQESRCQITEFIDREHIQWLFLCLNEQEREMIYLYYFEGHPQREIALRYGLSRASVSKIIHKALRKMEAHETRQARITEWKRGEPNAWPKTLTFH